MIYKLSYKRGIEIINKSNAVNICLIIVCLYLKMACSEMQIRRVVKNKKSKNQKSKNQKSKNQKTLKKLKNQRIIKVCIYKFEKCKTVIFKNNLKNKSLGPFKRV